MAPIFVLGALIFVHELGHFLVAKWCGVGVLKFSVGFGPVLWKFRRGETQYQLSAIPLGGFVRMIGDLPRDTEIDLEEDEELLREDYGELFDEPETRALIQDRKRWFIEQNLWKKSAIVFAGPLFNFIFAIFVVFLSTLLYGQQSIDERPVIGGILAASPADKAGIQAGDEFVSIDGKMINAWEEAAETIRNGDGSQIEIAIRRDGEPVNISLTPQEKTIPGIDGQPENVFLIGIEPNLVYKSVGFFDAVKNGFVWTFTVTARTYTGLWGMFTGLVSPKDLAGPLFIIGEAGNQAERGMDYLLFFMAILSVSLAVLNLLPIPVLDGGHLMFFALEAIFGPISFRKKEVAQQFGILVLISLMVFAIHNDIQRTFSDESPGRAEPKWNEETEEAEKP